MRFQTIWQRLRRALASSDDLRQKRYRGDSNPFCGHCYIATEALFHLYGKTHGYTPRVTRIADETHWWLENQNGDILDPTADQLPKKFNYQGRACGFLTKNPSKRCQTLVERMKLLYMTVETPGIRDRISL